MLPQRSVMKAALRPGLTQMSPPPPPPPSLALPAPVLGEGITEQMVGGSQDGAASYRLERGRLDYHPGQHVRAFDSVKCFFFFFLTNGNMPCLFCATQIPNVNGAVALA